MIPETILAQLDPTPAQQAALDATLEAFAGASAEAVAVGRQAETTSNVVIHRFCYQRLRTTFGLSANLTVRAIAHAARRLKDTGGTGTQALVEYDARTLSLSADAHTVSLSTVCGRVKDISLCLDAEPRRRLQTGRPIHAVLSQPEKNRYVLAIRVVVALSEKPCALPLDLASGCCRSGGLAGQRGSPVAACRHAGRPAARIPTGAQFTLEGARPGSC